MKNTVRTPENVATVRFAALESKKLPTKICSTIYSLGAYVGFCTMI